MKKSILTYLIAFTVTSTFFAQGYEIKVNFKGAKDTLYYLVKYTFDQQYIADTAKHVKNGVGVFKGKTPLDKGVYTLVSQEKGIYFDFFVNENQKFTIGSDMKDMVNNLKSTGNSENENFFAYVKYLSNKNREVETLKEKTKGKSKADSAKFMNDNLKTLNDEVKKFESDFMTKNKGTYLFDVLNLKTEKEAKDIPKASNGRPDSVYQYYYYKNHFWDGVDFKDERIIRTPFFDDRVKKYFDNVIVANPDTVISEIDKLLKKCNEGNLVYNLLIGHLTYKYEQSKIMGFDKVFCHIAGNYIVNGKAKAVYSEETVEKIKERYLIMKDLLLGAKVSELYMIDTTHAKEVLKMGFDTAKTSKAVTDLYYKNLEKLTPMFRSLYQVKAKYTVLIFWASDCGHCKTEIPKLHEKLKELNGKIDHKVYAVQTKDDVNEWKKFIRDNKLSDFIHVFDPIHLNDLKTKFDIYSTPVIYILDKDKNIVAKRLSAEQVNDMLNLLEDIEKEKAKKK
ncbi:MAG: DUF5106 domain-containing protein [Bacteroidetes bacterium]|nr:DUF5106 domain-containing protein [Bacteroidota bacterium]